MVGKFAGGLGRKMGGVATVALGGIGAGLGLAGIGGIAGMASKAVGAASKYSPKFQNSQTRLNYTLERLQMILADKIGPILAKVLDALNAILQWWMGDNSRELPVFSGEMLLQDWARSLSRANP